MKISVFRTQAKIGSFVRYKQKEYRLADLDRNNNMVCLHPHKRERLYIIAYSNKIRLQSNIRECGRFNSIFKQWASDTNIGYTCAKRIYEIPAYSTIRNGDGLSGWSHRVGAIGNAVNPCVAKYLFECIKIFDKNK